MEQPLEGHADRRFDGELNTLHLLMLEMGGLAREQSQLGLRAVLNQDLHAAALVLKREPRIDAMESEVDDKIVELISRRGPVSKDLRITMAFSKMVADLEHIGDEAARLAYIAIELYDGKKSEPSSQLLRDVQSMGKIANELLAAALQGFDQLDPDLARSLLNSDKELDAEFQSALRHLATFVLEDARNVGQIIHITLAIKALERIGAHAGNIAESLIYLLHGVDVRHRKNGSNLASASSEES